MIRFYSTETELVRLIDSEAIEISRALHEYGANDKFENPDLRGGFFTLLESSFTELFRCLFEVEDADSVSADNYASTLPSDGKTDFQLERPPVVAVTGWYGEGNLGDEIILESLIQSISRVSPRSQVVVAAPRPSAVEISHGVAAFPRHEMRSMSNLAQYADCLVVGGGGIWNDKSIERNGGLAGLFQSPKFSATNLAVLPLMFCALGKPVAGIGLGVGPLNTSVGRAVVRLLAKSCNFISVRDRFSLELLEGVVSETIDAKTERDLAYSWRPMQKRSRIQDQEFSGLTIGFNFREFDEQGIGVVGWPAISDALRIVGERIDCRFVGIPMQEQDMSSIGRVFEAAGLANCFVLDFTSDTSQIASDIASLDIMVGMRLHSSILAHLSGVPAIGLNYETKIYAYFEDILEVDRILDQGASCTQIVGLIESVLHDRFLLREKILDTFAKMHSSSADSIDNDIGRLLHLTKLQSEPAELFI